MNKTTKYLKTFFAEKNLPEVTFELIAKDGMTHYMPNEVVIEHIMIAPASEQEKIATVIRKIDFANGDVNDFLKHLAGALIEVSHAA